MPEGSSNLGVAPAMRTPLCIAFALLAASFAYAAPKASPGKKYLDSAVKLYGAFEFERALAQLDKAHAHSDGREMDVAIALYQGIVELELGRDDLGTEAFKTALAIDANAVLPTRVSPKVQQLFDDLKAQAGSGVKSLPPTPAAEAPPPPPTPPPEAAATPPVPPAAAATTAATPPEPERVLPPKPAPARVYRSSTPGYWWTPAAAGAALGLVGVILLFEAKSRSDLLSGRAMASFTLETAERYESEGNAFQALGFTGLALTVVGVALAAGLYFVGDKLGLASWATEHYAAFAEVW